jgi:hypothetical protein
MDEKSRKTRFRWEGAQYSRALEPVNRRHPRVLSLAGDFVSPMANQGGFIRDFQGGNDDILCSYRSLHHRRGSGPCILQRRSWSQIGGRGPRLADFCVAARGGGLPPIRVERRTRALFHVQ